MPGVDAPVVAPPNPDLIITGTGTNRNNVSSSGSRVHVTPHRLVVVLLIREYCHYKLSVPVSPKDRTATSLLILSLVQSPDLDLTAICNKIIDKLKLSGLIAAWARGVTTLQEEGVAGVMDLIQTSVEKLLTTDQYPVNRSSVIGLLLRQMFLSFDKLTFSEVSSLKQQFDQYYRAGRESIRKISEHCDQNSGESFEMSLESGDESKMEYMLPNSLPQEFSVEQNNDFDEDEASCGVSKKQADLFLAQQALLLQNNESAALSPKELQSEISRILKSCPSPGMPEAHFLSYLNCLRVKEQAGAVHALYGSCTQQDDGQTSKLGPDDGNKGFRFAALNLAGFHVRQGHKEEAMSAIKEAITMAQESSDHTCLQHILSLLHRIVDDKDKQRLMERGVNKCSDLNLTYLTSLSLLSLASHLSTTARAEVSHVLELVARSDLINCQHSITELQAASLMVKSAVWSVYGRPGLSLTLAQMLLQQLQHCGEFSALALVNIVMWLDNQAMSNLADTVLATAEKLFSSKYSQWGHIVSQTRDRIHLRRALAGQDWSHARTVINRMSAVGVADADLQQAQLLMRQGYVVESRDILQKIISTADEKSELRVRALIGISDIFNLSKSPAFAVQSLMKAIDISKRNKQDLLYHLSLLHLANCHLQEGFPEKGYSLTVASLPFILSHGGVEDCAKAWLLAAKCKIGACKDVASQEKRVQVLEGAEMVAKSKEKFRSIGEHTRVQDCLYLLARLYHALKLTQERNMAASQYKKLEDLYPVRSRITMECLL